MDMDGVSSSTSLNGENPSADGSDFDEEESTQPFHEVFNEHSRRSKRSVTANVGAHLQVKLPTFQKSSLWMRRNSAQLEACPSSEK
mmetsp:Transcript_114809/g.180780  ORF Transcript_114809/g.180780 Transcript_114809/m.180780 type:complete len:86 (+) Transcript_114809:202-459(+)